MIGIKCSWLILSDSHYIAYFVLSQFYVNLWQDFISVLYVQELGGGQLLLISGSLLTRFPPQTFRVYHGEGKEALSSHDSDSHIPVIHGANALIFMLFWAQPIPSHFFFPVRKHQLCANLFLIPPNHPVKLELRLSSGYGKQSLISLFCWLAGDESRRAPKNKKQLKEVCETMNSESDWGGGVPFYIGLFS